MVPFPESVDTEIVPLMLLLAALDVGELVGKVVGGSCLVTGLYDAVWEAREPVATLPAWTTFVPAGPAGRPLVAATTAVGGDAAVVGPYLFSRTDQLGSTSERVNGWYLPWSVPSQVTRAVRVRSSISSASRDVRLDGRTPASTVEELAEFASARDGVDDGVARDGGGAAGEVRAGEGGEDKEGE